MKPDKNKAATPSPVAPVTAPAVAAADTNKQTQQVAQWRTEPFPLVNITCEELEETWGYDTSKLTEENWNAFCHRVADCLDDAVNSAIEYRAEQFHIARLPQESPEA
jgi:hypothetical protein